MSGGPTGPPHLLPIGATAHVLFVGGLVAITALIWLRRKLPGRGLAVLIVAVWLIGLLAVHGSLAGRGPAWLSGGVRSFAFELKPGRGQPLGSHHEIVFPPFAKRLPQAFAQADGPLAMHLEFRLEPSGRVQQVSVTASSGSPDLDRAVSAAVGAWRFGPLPPDYQPAVAETVKLRLVNRYQFLQQGRLAALVACMFVGLWMLTTWLLPPRPSPQAGGALADSGPPTRRMLAAAGCLAALGWLMIWRLAPDIGQGRADLPMKQASFLVVSVAGLWVAAALARRWQGFGRAVARLGWFWVAAGVLLLLLTRFTPLGTDLGTGHRLWLRVPGGVVQTVELVKLLLVFFVAAAAYPAAFGGLVERQGGRTRVVRMRPWLERYRGMLGAFALVLATLALMKDFGPILLLALVLLCLLSAQGHRRQSAFGLAVLLALLSVSYLIGVPSRWRERVEIWRDPWHETAADSHSLRQGREHLARVAWGISGGGMLGTGLARGSPQDIAEVQSDFIYAALAEELGWVGGAVVLALALALVASGLSLAARREDAFEKALLAGIASLLGIQAALTIGGNLGLWPLTGITLPFVSYGGSSLLVNFLALGICVGIAGRSPELRASSLPLPRDLSQRVNASLGKLQIGFVLLFALLAAKAAWLQWPAAEQTATRLHLYADGTGLANPRLDSPTWVPRGRFLDRGGQPIADPQQYVHLTGFEAPGRRRVGLQNYLNDALSGRLKRAGALFPWQPREQRGYDVVLTLDPRLQAKAYELLKAKLARRGGRGCIVGVAPETGEVLIAANWPPLAASASVEQWLACYDSKPGALPFCYRKVYAPGSTFKTLVAAAALQTGALSPTDRVRCEGSYTIYQGVRPIRDWQLGRSPGWSGHGDRTLREALVPSCNSIFAKVGVELGWKRLLEFASDAWFDVPLPLLPEEWRGGRRDWFESASSAVVANREVASELSKAEQDPVWLAQTALGQRDVRMTPLHMAVWAATIANHGRMMAPTVVRAIQDEEGNQVREFAPRELSRVMSEETAAQLAAMMEDVVASPRGTGHPAWTPNLRIAGKTGTPETGLGGNDAVFIAFGPVENPKLALAVVLEDTAGGGGSTAGPIVKALMESVRY